MINNLRTIFQNMLVNTHDDSTIGFLVERTDPDDENLVVKEYEPAIMWNLAVKRYEFALHFFPAVS